MELLPTYNEIIRDRETVGAWYKRFKASTLHDLYDGKRSVFDSASEVLNQFGNVAIGSQVKIGDLDFGSERLIDGEQVYLVSPKENGPINKGLLKDLVAGTSSGFGYWQALDCKGPLIAVYLPDTFTRNNKNALPGGWVVDFGHFIFITSKALEGLADRSLSHKRHEANHLKRQILWPEMHNQVYEPNPYLNEAVAILDQLHLAAGYRMAALVDRDPGNLSAGLDLYYLNKLLVEEIVKPIDFKIMNGDGKFVSELYKHRFAFAIFLKVIITSTTINKESLIKNVSDIDFINSGMTGFLPQFVFDRSRTMDVLDLIDRNLEAQRKAGQKLSDENFWKLLLDGYQLGQHESYKELAESLWKKHLKYILPIYLTLMCSSSGNIKDFVESFDVKIKDILANDCPDFYKAAVDSMVSRYELFAMKNKIQFPK